MSPTGLCAAGSAEGCIEPEGTTCYACFCEEVLRSAPLELWDYCEGNQRRWFVVQSFTIGTVLVTTVLNQLLYYTAVYSTGQEAHQCRSKGEASTVQQLFTAQFLNTVIVQVRTQHCCRATQQSVSMILSTVQLCVTIGLQATLAVTGPVATGGFRSVFVRSFIPVYDGFRGGNPAQRTETSDPSQRESPACQQTGPLLSTGTLSADNTALVQWGYGVEPRRGSKALVHHVPTHCSISQANRLVLPIQLCTHAHRVSQTARCLDLFRSASCSGS